MVSKWFSPLATAISNWFFEMRRQSCQILPWSHHGFYTCWHIVPVPPFGLPDPQWSGSYQHVQLHLALLTVLNFLSIHNASLLYTIVCVLPLLKTWFTILWGRGIFIFMFQMGHWEAEKLIQDSIHSKWKNWDINIGSLMYGKWHLYYFPKLLTIMITVNVTEC